MIDLGLLGFVLFKKIHPLAKAKGRNPVRWMLLTSFVWMMVELFIIAVNISPIILLIFLTGRPKETFFLLLRSKIELKDIWASWFVYTLAISGGYFSSMLVRKHLGKLASEESHEPPAPILTLSESENDFAAD